MINIEIKEKSIEIPKNENGMISNKINEKSIEVPNNVEN